jgi:hypothetical protein
VNAFLFTEVRFDIVEPFTRVYPDFVSSVSNRTLPAPYRFAVIAHTRADDFAAYLDRIGADYRRVAAGALTDGNVGSSDALHAFP